MRWAMAYVYEIARSSKRKRLLQMVALSCVFASSSATALPPAGAKPVGCAVASFPEDTRIAEPSSGELAGIYKRGGAALAVRRQGYRFWVDIPGSSSRELRLVREWRFEDGCGAVYQFSQSAIGLGSRLTITGRDGAVSVWRRDAT